MITPQQAFRRAEVVRLRNARLSWNVIGQRLSISGQRAGQLYRAALAEAPVPDREGFRAKEIDFVDLAIRELIRIAVGGKTTPATQVEAWRALRAWAERKSALLGLDEPTRQHELTIEEIDRQIALLERSHTIDELADDDERDDDD